MIARIDPSNSAVYFDDLRNVQQGEFYVDADYNVQCRGTEEREAQS